MMYMEKRVLVKNVYKLATYWLSGKEKVPGVVVNKEGYADSLLGHEMSHQNWFSWKSCICKQIFLMLTP